MAGSDAAKESQWLRKLFLELRLGQLLDHNQSVIQKHDNQAMINLALNPQYSSRTKHIDVRAHFIRDLVKDKLVTLSWVSRSSQLADFLTKSLPTISFQRAITKIVSGG